jgi:ribonuclease VapC
LPIQVIGVDAEQLEWARIAFRKFGRGRHAASLNFGDCFPYALSKVTGEPLLYKGLDFSQTGVASALHRS